MDRISPSLQERIAAAGPDSTRRLDLIVTLQPSADWREEIRRLEETGLEVSCSEEAVRAVFGSAAVRDIPHLAALSTVQLVEPGGEVRSSPNPRKVFLETISGLKRPL
jgi:hypothetical protein